MRFRAALVACVCLAPVVRAVPELPAVTTPFALSTGDFTATIDPPGGWSLTQIHFRDKPVSLAYRAHDLVVRFSDRIFVGASSIKPEPEEILSVTLLVDEATVDPASAKRFQGERIEYTRRTRLRGLEATSKLTVLPDRIERETVLEVKADTVVKQVWPLTFVWQPTTTEWLARTRDGRLVHGSFDGAGDWEMQESVHWTAVFNPRQRLAMVTAFPRDMMDGVVRKHAYWDLEASHQQRFHAMDNQQLKQGETYRLGATLRILPAKKADWKKTVTDAATQFGLEPVVAGESDEPQVVYPGLIDDSERMRKIRQRFQPLVSVTDPEWLTNPVGMEALDPDTVLRPWTPVKVEDGSVRVLGRTYTLGQWGLPAQIRAANAEILAGPIRLVIHQGGESRAVEPGPVRPTAQYRGLARFASEAQCARSWFQATAVYEYDGLIRLDLSMASTGHKLFLDKLELIVPIKAEHAKFLSNAHSWTRGGETQASPADYGRLNDGQGTLYVSGHRPLVWLGDYERGLCWFSESEQHWFPQGNDKAVRIARTDDVVELRVSMISGAHRLNRTASLTFGLMATPAKPLPRGWRGWRMTSHYLAVRASEMNNPNIGNRIIFWSDGYRVGRLYPVARDDDEFSRNVAHLRKLGVDGIYAYQDITLLGVRGRTQIEGEDFWFMAPEWPVFGKDWAIDPPLRSTARQHVSIASSWQDFLLWQTKHWIVKNDVNGVYLDEIFPHPDTRADHGLGYRHGANEIRPSYAIFAMRDYFKRLRYLFETHGDNECPIFVHMSATMMLPYLSFADVMLDGEQYWYDVSAWRKPPYPSYIEMTPLDRYHAMTGGPAFGAVPVFLPEFRPDALADRFPDAGKQVAPTREFLALTLLADILVWPVWCNSAVVTATQQIKADYGVADSSTRFHGYWRAAQHNPLVSGDVKVSYYANKNGILAIVSNLTREGQRVELDWKRIHGEPGAPNWQAWQAETDDALPLEGAVTAMEVPGHDFAMVRYGVRR